LGQWQYCSRANHPREWYCDCVKGQVFTNIETTSVFVLMIRLNMRPPLHVRFHVQDHTHVYSWSVNFFYNMKIGMDMDVDLDIDMDMDMDM
jgi:hypothetical protein